LINKFSLKILYHHLETPLLTEFFSLSMALRVTPPTILHGSVVVLQEDRGYHPTLYNIM